MRIRFRSFAVASSVALCAAWLAHTPARAQAGAHEALGYTDRLIVKYRSAVDTPREARAEMSVRLGARRHGLQVQTLKRVAGGAQVFDLGRVMSHAEVRQVAAGLLADNPDIEYAEPDRLLHILAQPNDAMLAQQWSLSDPVGGIGAATAWSQSTGAGVVVAVIDTGVRPHADLQPNLLAGYDFITSVRAAGDGNGRDANAFDPGDFVTAGACGSGHPAEPSSWHGTHVAGIVAAKGGNSIGVAGVAHGARVLPLRVLGKCGGYVSDIANAISWAAGAAVTGVPANANPARVINLSLGGTGPCDRTTQAAIDTARSRGAVVVVAAGNEGSDVAGSNPANCSGVVAVAATQRSGGLASYSNRGAGITLAAPGGDERDAIVSTLNAGRTAPGADSYASLMGTSMATPVVSGVAALMLAVNANLSPDQLMVLLQRTARPFSQACTGCGSGIVDAAAAVAAASGTPSIMPAPVTPPVSTAPVAVAEVEPNHTQATAQRLSTLPARVTGALATAKDLDHYRLQVAPGRTLTAELSIGPAAGLGLNAYGPTGQLLMSVTGAVGQTRRLMIRNLGSTATAVVLRVLRSSGASGAYRLDLSQAGADAPNMLRSLPPAGRP